MAYIVEISDISAPELDTYARLTEAQLRNRLEPDKGIFIAESAKVIDVALREGYQPKSLLMERRYIGGQGAALMDRCGDVPVYTADRSVLSGLTGYTVNRGILCAMSRPAARSPEQVCAGARRVAVLENIVDSTNIGAIFRSAAALGMDGVLLTETCCDPLNRRAVRVSMGTVLQVPWAYVSHWPEAGLDALRAMGFKTAAMALSGECLDIDAPELGAAERLAVVLGAEGDGLAPRTVAACDWTVRIPMKNGVDSLNVAAAGAVAFCSSGPADDHYDRCPFYGTVKPYNGRKGGDGPMEGKCLNAAQMEAVTSTEGYIRVIAGAGSGKTRALTHRFAYLVNELGILPGNILCVTFTNKAAGEMRQRIHNLTGDNDTGYINTFHGFCVSVLQEDSYAVQYPKSFLVLDNSDIDAMLKIIYEERGLTLRDMTFANARDMIEIQKLFKRPEYYLDMLTMDLDTLREKYEKAVSAQDIIFYGYLYQEKKCFGLDYNDLIKFTLYIFQQHEPIRLKWQKRLEYIMIDEFQDIDSLQYELMEQLCGYHRNLFIVGDPDQTIYTWRGADVRYLLDFDKHFPGTKTIMMMENYRSTPQILAAANSLIDKNRARIKKDLLPMLPAGPSVLCHWGKTAQAEAEWMAFQMGELHDGGVPYRDMAVLYRAHYVSRPVEEVLLKRKIPYAIYSGVQFFDRMEIKDALSYLRMIAYKDDLSFRRVVNSPKRNMGQRRMKFLEETAARRGCSLYDALLENLDDGVFKGAKAGAFVDLIERFAAGYAGRPVSEVLSAILNDSGYELALRTEGSQERLDNLAELKQSIYEYETTCGEEATLEHYLSHVALFSNADAQQAGDKVKLMTVHAAKGLEFPYVFLCGMNEGVFPSRKTRTLPGMEEERRLAFVAVTRAEKRLYISQAEGRNLDGSPRYPSRFVLDIDPGLLEYTEKPREGLIADAREYIALSQRYLPEAGEGERLSVGDRVEHSVLGPGIVAEVDEERSAYVIRFDAMPTPRAIAFRAKLRRVEKS